MGDGQVFNCAGLTLQLYMHDLSFAEPVLKIRSRSPPAGRLPAGNCQGISITPPNPDERYASPNACSNMRMAASPVQ